MCGGGGMGERESVDLGSASATALNFQDGLASTLPAAPLCCVPSTLWVTVTPVLQYNPALDSSCSLLLPATGITARWLRDPSKGRVWQKGGGAFPSQKGHTPGWKMLRVEGQRGLKSTTPSTPRQVAPLGSAGPSQAQLREPSAQVQICLATLC